MKNIAKESRLVGTARNKLEGILKKEQTQFNPATMKRIAATIKNSILRHHPERGLEKREIILFDENRHSAPVKNSQVLTLFNKTQKGLISSRKTASKLRPRLK